MSFRHQLNGRLSLVYVDDIGHLRRVLSLVRDADVSLQLQKCNFFTGTFNYLGHVKRPGRLEIATHTMDGLKTKITLKNDRTLLAPWITQLFPSFHVQLCMHSSSVEPETENNQPTLFSALSADKLKAMYELQDKLVLPQILVLLYAGRC